MRVRKPAVSGLFYPPSKDDLLQVIENCFMHSYGPQKKPPVDSDKNIIGMICPHAGYTYSGPIAAHSYYASSSLDVDLIVMIGPNHYGIGSGITTMKEGSWETPLGLISIDTNSVENVVRISGIVDYDNNAHSVDHCLEVQLPMLQYIYEKFKILPIIMWMQDKETATDVGKAIAEIIKNRNALLIASSDFTHYEPNEEAHKKDNELIKAILEIDVNKIPITDEVFYKSLECEAVILGACGGPKWDNLEFSKKPERALLKLRKELKLFANLRPAICFKQLVDSSTLKPEIVSGLNIMIVRELIGGIYFGEPRGIKPIENGERKGINTHSYTSSEIQRIARVAFELAKKRNNKVTSCEKSNVMESGMLWREEVQTVQEKEFSEVKLNHMLADNCAMQLLRNPKQFDVILADNLFGDMLSDEAAMLTGSLGLLPSASLGAKNKNGQIRSLYEPVHGSAPDIAGKGLANPIATILSFAMALKYSLNLDKEADNLEKAVQDVLDDGLRTKDIISKGMKEVSTSQMGDAIISKLK